MYIHRPQSSSYLVTFSRYLTLSMASALSLLEIKIELIEISLRSQRVFRDRLNPLESCSHAEFIARYRIIRHMFIQLLEDISGNLHRSTARCHSIPPVTQLAVALQFLAIGTFQTVLGSAHRISQTSVSRCLTAVCEALTVIAPAYIKFPNKSRQRVIQEYFLESTHFLLFSDALTARTLLSWRHQRSISKFPMVCEI